MITFKADIDDHVYFIYNNEIKHSTILGMKAEKDNNTIKIKYKFKFGNTCIWLDEYRLFRNKVELLTYIKEFM